PFVHEGRITHVVESGQLFADIGLPELSPETDRAMLCGSPHMLADVSAMLDKRGFVVSSGVGQPGDYVIERAFVDKETAVRCGPIQRRGRVAAFQWDFCFLLSRSFNFSYR